MPDPSVSPADTIRRALGPRSRASDPVREAHFALDARRDILWLPLHRVLCPEHKRLRNRLQRSKAAAVRAAGEGDTPT